MGLYPCNNQQRRSIPLDAGYVICQSSPTIELHGKKLIFVICMISSLFVISLVNLTCLLWFMYKLDWSLFDQHGSRVFRIDRVHQRVEFHKQIISNSSIYTTQVTGKDRIDVLADKQIDLYGNENSMSFDDNQIVLNIDRFHVNNRTAVDWTNLHSLKFNSRMKTRVHLGRINSQHIHHRRLNISATNQLNIRNVKQASFVSQSLVLEANRHNRRSILRLKNQPKKKKNKPKISSGSLHVKSDSIYLDLPHLPLLGHHYRKDYFSIARLCICETTLALIRISAHESCPLC